MNSKKDTIGLSPYTMVFKGEKKVNNAIIRMINYDSNNLIEKELNHIEECLLYKKNSTVTWINIDGLHDEPLMESISEVFSLNPMVLADVMNPDARAKVVEYDECLYISIKMLAIDPNTKKITHENLSLVLGNNYILTFQEVKGDVFEPIRTRIRKKKKRICSLGPDFLLFSLLDVVIDNYIYIIGLLGDKIDALEDYITLNPSKEILQEINLHKKDLNILRRSIHPAREMIINLVKLDNEFILKDNYIHFKELQDNIHQSAELSDGFREFLNDQLGIYHTNLGSNLNEIMKILTLFSVIFIPLTFIAGVYGTNFVNFPEIHFEYGYFYMLTLMSLVSSGMLIWFKRKKWL